MSVVSPLPQGRAESRGWWSGIVALVAVVVLAYANGLGGPFVLDDSSAIAENPSIRSLRTAWSPPADRGTPVTGRPLVNVTLAIDYAWHGLNPRGYHVTNVCLHGLAALVLFGLVRQTLHGLRDPRLRQNATVLAWTAAALWATHPLTTAAVTYLSQRAEVLVTLAYLGTLGAAARGLHSSRPTAWSLIAVAGCWLGMATKEVMVSAPVVVLLYDWTFSGLSVRELLHRRGWLYAGLAASWALLGWLMHHAGGRAGTAGFSLPISPWHYALTQCEALVHYLRLVFWPAPLVFDYGGTRLVTSPLAVWPQALLLLALLGAAIVAVVRRSPLGFVGGAAFAILAPTSSFVPVADTVFEHRMYLPLAALLAAVVVLLAVLGVRRLHAGLLACVALLALTVHRNRDYRTELTLWWDTVAKNPTSVRGHYTLGTAFAATGRDDLAIAEYRRALDLDPRSSQAHNDLANALVRRGNLAAALVEYEAALAITPTAEAHNNVANLLLRLGRSAAAREHYFAALRLRPSLADAHNNLGNLLAQSGDLPGAREHYEAALALRPDLADAHANLGNVLAQTGATAAAIQHYEHALALRPNFPDAHLNLANTLANERRWADAIPHYEAALQLRPGFPGAQAALDRARMAEEMFRR